MRLSFGRYLAYDSIIHRMDPRLKLIMIISLIVCIFFPDGFTGYVLLGIIIYAIYFISKLRFRLLFLLARPIVFMVIILFIVNCFLVKTGNLG